MVELVLFTLPPYYRDDVLIAKSTRKTYRSMLSQLKFHKGRIFRNLCGITALKILSYIVPIETLCRPFEGDTINIKKYFTILSSCLKNRPISIMVYRGSRKLLGPVFTTDGQLIGYAKYYFGKNERVFGLNEYNILKSIKSNYPQLGNNVPEVLSFYTDDIEYLAIYSTKTKLKLIRKMNQQHVDWLIRIFKVTCTRESSFFNDMYDFIEQSFKNRELYEWLLEHMERIRQLMFKYRISYCLAQREFPYYHMLINNSEPFVIDWEMAKMGYPPFFDLFSCILSDFKRGSKAEKYLDYNQLKVILENRKYRIYMIEYSSALSVNHSLLPDLFFLFCLDQAKIYFDSNHEKSFIKVLDWIMVIKKDIEMYRNIWLRAF